MYILDTDTFTLYLRGNENVLRHIREVGPEHVYLSSITIHEHLKGRLDQVHQHCAPRPGNNPVMALARLTQSLEILCQMNVVDYDEAAEALFLSLPPEVRRMGQMDSRIAAVAMASSMIVVTANTRHFSKIPGLRFEDWTVVAEP